MPRPMRHSYDTAPPSFSCFVCNAWTNRGEFNALGVYECLHCQRQREREKQQAERQQTAVAG